MKTLITSEKPDQAKKYAEILGVPTKNLGGFYENEQFIITWAIGHMIGLKMPEEINEEYKTWSLEPLPFKVPDLNKDLKIDSKKSKQIAVIKKLINRKDVDRIINGGDADREGLLIQEEIYDFAKCNKPIYVLWAQSIEKNEIMKCMANLKERKDFINILNSAKARECLDYMYGMSYSRANKMIFYPNDKITIAYGRCQTPLLKLIADRDKEINEFVSKDYFQVEATFDKSYKGLLIDDKNEILKFENKKDADDIILKIDKKAKIVKFDVKNNKKCPPNLFSLTTLQNYLGSLYHYTLNETLSIVQSLYEKQITTYPRTDTEYINDDVFDTLPNRLNSAFKYIKINERLKTFNDIKNKICQPKKVEGHHAILPTEQACSDEKFKNLTEKEKIVYLTICKRLVAVLMPDYEYKSIEIITNSNNFNFKTNGTKPISLGWKKLYVDEEKKSLDEATNENELKIDDLKVGDNVNIINLQTLLKKTEPPKKYTIKTLSTLMEKYNIGRPSTRAEIVETLVYHKYITYSKNKYQTTPLGYEYVNKLPNEMLDVKITAEMEENLTKIVEGKVNYKDFLNNIYNLQVNQINKLKEYAKNLPKTERNNVVMNNKEIIGKCPFCGSNIIDSNDKAFSHEDFKTNKCLFVIWKNAFFTTINKNMAKELLSDGKTVGIFKKKDGSKYKQEIILNKTDMKLVKGEYVV